MCWSLSEQHLLTEQIEVLLERHRAKTTNRLQVKIGSLCVFVYRKKKLVHSQNAPGIIIIVVIVSQEVKRKWDGV